MTSILLSLLLSFSAHASVDDGHLVNPNLAGHGFLALTADDSTVPQHSPEEIARLEQDRADAVCNFLGSPSGLYFTRHAEEFDPRVTLSRASFAVVTFDDENQHWSASLIPLEAFSFATIHCVGD